MQAMGADTTRPTEDLRRSGARPGRLFAALRDVGDTLLVCLALVVVWQFLHWLAGEVAIASPWATVSRMVELLGQPSFWPHVQETLTAFAYALIYALGGGLIIGVTLGAHRLSGEVAEPILVALYSIPKITLYPVILLFFGLGMTAKVAFGAIHGIIPVIIFTMSAVRNINPAYLRTAQVLRMGPAETAWRVLMPATVPEIVSGFRVGFALTMLGTLIGELFASQRGLGFMILRSMERHDVATLMAVALLLFLFATISGWILLVIDRRLHRRI
jgi:NitT/TauT family transport system permease protein